MPIEEKGTRRGRRTLEAAANPRPSETSRPTCDDLAAGRSAVVVAAFEVSETTVHKVLSRRTIGHEEIGVIAKGREVYSPPHSPSMLRLPLGGAFAKP